MANSRRMSSLTRRYFLQVTGAGAVTATAIGGFGRNAAAQRGPFVWISPRGTVEVLDD